MRVVNCSGTKHSRNQNSATSEDMTNLKIQQALKILGMPAVLAANIFLFVPFTIYVGNLEEFIIPIWSIMKLFSIPAMIVIGLLIIMGGFMSKGGYRRYTVILAVVSLLIWLQGSILVWEYGLLDGLNIDWTQAAWRGWIDLGIWISAIILTMAFNHIVEKPVTYLAVTIFSLQLIILAFTGIQHADGLLEKAHSSSSPDALREIYRFSSGRNVLHIILDGFQADVFKDIISISDKLEGGHYRSALDGFIYFEEHMGVFPSTYLSLPALLSGEIYRNHIPKRDFIKTVFGGKTILNSAFERGYEVDLVSVPPMIGMLTIGHYTNAYLIPKNYVVTDKEDTLSDTTKLFDLTLFRLAPHFLKKHIYNNQRWFVQNHLRNAGSVGFFIPHNAFLDNLTKNMSADRSAPVYKFFHLMNTHAPMVVNSDCTYAGESLPRNRLTITSQLKCSMDFVIALFNRMKELGVYDDSLIILMADHGGHLRPYRFKPQKVIGVNDTSEIDTFIASMVTPLMMVKTPGSSGPLRISTAPTSILDTAATISTVLKLDEKFDGRSILDLSPSEQRERRHYYYEWRHDDNVTEYTGPIQEFLVNGSVYDRKNWHLGNEYLPPLDTK